MHKLDSMCAKWRSRRRMVLCTLHFYWWRTKQKAFLSDSGEMMDALFIHNCSITVQNDV